MGKKNKVQLILIVAVLLENLQKDFRKLLFQNIIFNSGWERACSTSITFLIGIKGVYKI